MRVENVDQSSGWEVEPLYAKGWCNEDPHQIPKTEMGDVRGLRRVRILSKCLLKDFRFPLRTSSARDHQYDARRDRSASSDWRNRNGFVMLCCRLDWADIENFFRFGVADAFRRKGEHTEDNKNDPQN